MKSAREVRLEIGLVLERVVPLGVRHGARVEPGVDHSGTRRMVPPQVRQRQVY